MRDYTLRNIVLRLFHKPESSYSDYGIWNSDFVDEFSKMDEYEFHIISPHNGMIKNKIVEFEEDGINYHIYKCDSNLVTEAFHSYTHYNERTDYRCLRKKILNIVERISPQVIIVCGAEQPKFSPVIWDLHNTPTLVLLETAVNDPLLMKMMRGAGIYGFVERRSFAEMHYFCTGIKKYYSIVRQFNKDAECLLFSRFPSHVPPLEKCPVKEFDFLFYAAVISQNKGVEDVILAFNKVVDSYPTATLNICGKIDDAEPDRYEHFRIVALTQGIVGAIEDCRRRLSVFCQTADGCFRPHHEKRCRNALSGHVSYNQNQFITIYKEEIVKISSNLLRRIHGGVNLKVPAREAEVFRQSGFLYGMGKLKFLLYALFCRIDVALQRIDRLVDIVGQRRELRGIAYGNHFVQIPLRNTAQRSVDQLQVVYHNALYQHRNQHIDHRKQYNCRKGRLIGLCIAVGVNIRHRNAGKQRNQLVQLFQTAQRIFSEQLCPEADASFLLIDRLPVFRIQIGTLVVPHHNNPAVPDDVEGARVSDMEKGEGLIEARKIQR